MNDEITDQILAAMDRIPRGPTPYATACMSTVATPTPPISAEQLLSQINNLVENMPPEPFGEFMRSKGYPPETCTLVLPENMRADVLFPPPYVWFSPMALSPTMIRFRL